MGGNGNVNDNLIATLQNRLHSIAYLVQEHPLITHTTTAFYTKAFVIVVWGCKI